MRARLIWLARGGFYGFLLVMLVGIAAASTIGMVVDLTHTSSFKLALGPLPLMSAWSDSNGGMGFQTEWGVGALAYVGAAVGVALAWRALPKRGNAPAS
jgi:hypothetical protein